MRDFYGGGRRKLIDWLAIDSWIDSGLYNLWIGFKNWWSGYSTFFGRFEVKGFVRGVNDLACEVLTLALCRPCRRARLRVARLRDRARQDEPGGRV